MSMITPKRLLVTFIAAILLIGIIMVGWAVYQWHVTKTPTAQTEKARCLEEYEDAVFSTQSNRDKKQADTVTISVIDTRTNATTTSFTESITSAGHYHPVELRKCGVYFTQSHNLDYQTRKSLPGYTASIKKFDYNGNEESSLVIEQDTLGSLQGFEQYYQSDYRVSPDEKYIFLIASYVGEDDYRLEVKDLHTMQEVFVLGIEDIQKQEPNAMGSFEFFGWPDDDRYFWTSLFEGAYTQGWIRIDTTDWSYEVYKAPGSGTDTMNGYPLNTTTGWIPYIPGSFWSGIVEIDEQINEDRKQQGETATLHLYNIFTKEDRVIYESNAPTWQDTGFFWKDDTTLEYTNPETGERVEYVVE